MRPEQLIDLTRIEEAVDAADDVQALIVHSSHRSDFLDECLDWDNTLYGTVAKIVRVASDDCIDCHLYLCGDPCTKEECEGCQFLTVRTEVDRLWWVNHQAIVAVMSSEYFYVDHQRIVPEQHKHLGNARSTLNKRLKQVHYRNQTQYKPKRRKKK